jgi:hypothetical protein
MRLLKTWIQIGLFLLGIGGALVGIRAGNHLLLGMGIFYFGLLILTGGIDLWIYKQINLAHYLDNQPKLLTGLVPSLWGLTLAVIGMVVMALGAGYAVFPGGPEKFTGFLMGTRLGVWVVFTLVGVLVSLIGIIHMVETVARDKAGVPVKTGSWVILGGGGFGFLFGMLLIGIALWGVLFGGIVDRLLHAILSGLQ